MGTTETFWLSSEYLNLAQPNSTAKLELGSKSTGKPSEER